MFGAGGMRSLEGLVLKGFELKDADTLLVIETDQGTRKYKAIGDCCSQSWFEEVDELENILGQKVVAVKEIALDHVVPPQADDEYNLLQLYGVKVQTEMGEAVIEFRNESNGYYGGYLEDVTKED